MIALSMNTDTRRRSVSGLMASPPSPYASDRKTTPHIYTLGLFEAPSYLGTSSPTRIVYACASLPLPRRPERSISDLRGPF
jgi:hypothetical protein